jgi:hypothetical protein
MIYGRFGDAVTVLRWGTLEDVRKLDGREPDQTDRAVIKGESYVVVQQSDGKERLYHLAFLSADGAWPEIEKALDALSERDG